MNTPDTTPGIKPADLRGILKYVPRFQNQTFVLALDGFVVADDNFPNLLVDAAVLRSLGIRLVIVHGIAWQLAALAQHRSVTPSDSDGSGVTDAPTLALAIEAAAQVSQDILGGLTRNGLKCAITNAVSAHPTGVIRGTDQLHTGRVDRIDRDFLNQLLSAAIIPVIQPLGYSPDGAPLRINSDLLAAELAEALGASKIIYLTPRPGLEIDGKIQRDISVETLRGLLAGSPSKIPAPLLTKITHALRAIETGTPRVHIVDGRAHDGLLNEVFSTEGVGTMIYASDYQQIRRATKADARLIHNLTRGSVRREELLHRTLQAIEKNIDRYYLFETDDTVIACAALTPFEEDPTLREIGSLYVQPYHQNRGIGRKMVDYAIHKAREAGAKRLVALSTQSPTFFTSVMNFAETTPDILPPSRRRQLDETGRNSKVLLKLL
ncbi:MAG: amino-acid N-acetyltransferase [Opitutaceae bacterium]|jgi:amino-acid N-acetyltransferase|nr:amino-acid N-acetyltransferase [Opitutaceae bacterium]